MAQEVVKRYSIGFKRHIVGEYESGQSRYELRRRYGMDYSTLDRWITQYSQEGLRHKLMRIQKPEEQERVRELEAQVAALEKALAQVTLDKMMLETTLEVAEEEYGVSFKKNSAPKSSAALKRNRSDR